MYRYLFDQLNTSLEIEAEVNELPLNSFPLVFFLFQDKHVVVEELLETLVDKVDPELFKRVQLKTITAV